MYDRVLVPTDGSPGTEPVLDHAADLAAAHDAELHAMYVVNAAGYAGLPGDAITENLGSMLNEQGEAALDSADERLDGPVERVLREGSPGEEIVAYADEAACDLIVMGTHGRGGLDRLLLGSVAERVVRTSTVPVLTVRVEDDPEEAAGDATTES